MSDRVKRLVKFFLRAVVTSVLLVWVFRQIDWSNFWTGVRTTNWGFLLASWILTVVFFVVNSYKLRVLLWKQGCRVRLGTVFHAGSVTALYSLLVPGLLSTGVKWYILNQESRDGGGVLSAMLYNQLSLLFAGTICALGALIVTNPTALLLPDVKDHWVFPAVCGAFLALLVLVYVLLLSQRVGGRMLRLLGWTLRPLPQSLRRKGQSFLQQVALFQAASWKFHLLIFLLSVTANFAVGALISICAGRAAHVDVAIGVYIWLFSIVMILGRLSISVGNLGVREATVVGFLTLYGIEKSSALLMSMVLFSGSVLMGLIGAGYQLARPLPAKERSAPPSRDRAREDEVPHESQRP
jgi:uncharacterized membrane protein YbhN (UPF0104 family)